MTLSTDNTVHGAVKDFLDLVSQRTGCTFSYIPVPRARAWMMLESGRADIMPAAVHNTARDRFALFVPTHQVRPKLLSLDHPAINVNSTASLLGDRLHVGVVRGYDFGPVYRTMRDELSRQGRLHVVADPQAIAQLLQRGRIQAAVIPPAAFADAGEASQLAQRLQWRELADLPYVHIGFYLSSSVLDDADQVVLYDAIRQAVTSGAYQRALRQHYPPWALDGVKGN